MEKNTKTETNVDTPLDPETGEELGMDVWDCVTTLPYAEEITYSGTDFHQVMLENFVKDLAKGDVAERSVEILQECAEDLGVLAMLQVGFNDNRMRYFEWQRKNLSNLDYCLSGTLSLGKFRSGAVFHDLALCVDQHTGNMEQMRIEDIDLGRRPLPQLFGETRFDLADDMWRYIEEQLGLTKPLGVFIVDEWPIENRGKGRQNEVQFLISKKGLNSKQIKAIKECLIDYWVKDFDSPEFGYARVCEFNPNVAEQTIDYCFKFKEDIERVNGFRISPMLHLELVNAGVL